MTIDETERWKRIALYLADCHAATAQHEGSLKSVSANRKKRFRNVCLKARALLKGEELPGLLTRYWDVDAVIARLADAEKEKP